MPYVTVRGHATHYETVGEGEPVLLLHGGFCSNMMMQQLAESLAGSFTVWSPERPGHGRTADQDGAMSYAGGLEQTIAFLDAVGIEKARVVGFSDGAIIGLLLALEHQERVHSLVAISGNLTPAGVTTPDVEADSDVEADAPQGDSSGSDAGEVDENWLRLRAEYDMVSPDGPEHAEIVLGKLLSMWQAEPAIDAAALGAIMVPSMIMVGDRDVIRPDHTRLIADSIPGAHLCVVPGASHMLLLERPALVNLAIGEFLAAVVQPTRTRGSSTP